MLRPQRRRGLGCLLYAARPDAGRANTNSLADSAYQRAHALQVRIPTAPTRVIRVADDVSKVRPLAADFAFLRHDTPRQTMTLWKASILADFSRTRMLFVPGN
jgi:hypothetical protein